MKLTLLFFILFQSAPSFPQRADGFFVQELCFVDPDLLRSLKVDKFEIQLYENNQKGGWIEVFLDSNQRKVKQVSHNGDKVQTTEYASTIISQFACPVVRPSYIKECVLGRITKTENDGASRTSVFDREGKLVADRWKPGANRDEISRDFSYTKNNLLDTATMFDIKSSGDVSKVELHVYQYNNDRLSSLVQQIDVGHGFKNTGRFTYQYFECGLVKSMEGTGYSGQYKAKVEFKYYSKDQLLQ